MYSVFSNYLSWRVSFGRNSSLSFGKLLSTADLIDEPNVLLMGSGYLVDADRYIDHPDVRKLIHWIGENLLKTAEKDYYLTRNVKIRIATGMLNKIDIPKQVKLHYHDNLIQNVYNLVADIAELPF